VLARVWLASIGAFDESDDPCAGTGVIALPRPSHPGRQSEFTIRFVPLRTSLVGSTDVCFRGCENTARSALIAVPVNIPDGSCAGAVACSQPAAAGLSKHRLARVSLVLPQAEQRRVGLNANSTPRRLSHRRGDAAVPAVSIADAPSVRCTRERRPWRSGRSQPSAMLRASACRAAWDLYPTLPRAATSVSCHALPQFGRTYSPSIVSSAERVVGAPTTRRRN